MTSAPRAKISSRKLGHKLDLNSVAAGALVRLVRFVFRVRRVEIYERCWRVPGVVCAPVKSVTCVRCTCRMSSSCFFHEPIHPPLDLGDQSDTFKVEWSLRENEPSRSDGPSSYLTPLCWTPRVFQGSRGPSWNRSSTSFHSSVLRDVRENCTPAIRCSPWNDKWVAEIRCVTRIVYDSRGIGCIFNVVGLRNKNGWSLSRRYCILTICIFIKIYFKHLEKIIRG